jgi:hypothetical protein
VGFLLLPFSEKLDNLTGQISKSGRRKLNGPQGFNAEKLPYLSNRTINSAAFYPSGPCEHKLIVLPVEL